MSHLPLIAILSAAFLLWRSFKGYAEKEEPRGVNTKADLMLEISNLEIALRSVQMAASAASADEVITCRGFVAIPEEVRRARASELCEALARVRTDRLWSAKAIEEAARGLRDKWEEESSVEQELSQR